MCVCIALHAGDVFREAAAKAKLKAQKAVAKVGAQVRVIRSSVSNFQSGVRAHNAKVKFDNTHECGQVGCGPCDDSGQGQA